MNQWVISKVPMTIYADSCNLMREPNFWVISRRLIISHGNSSRSSFLSTCYQFCYNFVVSEDTLEFLRISNKQNQKIEESSKFYEHWKEFEKYIKRYEMWLHRLRSSSWKHFKTFICFQKKCYKKIKVSCLFFISWFIQYLIFNIWKASLGWQ